jgi:soluble lytic murein transglycosylase
MLSYLYTQHNRWKTVLAVYDAGRDTVDEWLKNDRYIDENGNLITVPDASTSAFVEKIEKEMEMYRKLYYID